MACSIKKPQRFINQSALWFSITLSLLPITHADVLIKEGDTTLQAQCVVSPKQRARGLMYRVWLMPYETMLFVFQRPRPVSFWMKNTLIPLDIRFYDQLGNPIAHYPYVAPCTHDPCQTYPAEGKVKYVIERSAKAAIAATGISRIKIESKALSAACQ